MQYPKFMVDKYLFCSCLNWNTETCPRLHESPMQISTGRKIIGKMPIDVGAVQLEGFIGWLQKGYKGATQ